jgi:hypothetical protein
VDHVADTSLIVGSRPIVALARVIIWVLFVVAILVGFACLIGGGITIAQQLASGYTQLTLVADKPLPSNLHPAALYYINGEYATATMQARGLSAGVVALVTIGASATVPVQVALGGLVALLAWRLLRGDLFRRSIARAVSVSGLILAVGGIVSQTGIALASGRAAELNGGGRGFWPPAGSFDPTLPVVGVVLLLVGLAFEYGTRLQNETDGPV